MKHILARLLLLGGACMTMVMAQAAGTTAPDKFLSSAVQDGRAEVAVCQLALTNASSPEVKDFARRMIRDHSATDTKITALAQSKHYRLARGTTHKHKASYVQLQHRSGASFDKSFMEHNVSSHQNDIKNFTDQAQNSKDAEVKSFAAATLATLTKHLAIAHDVTSRLVAAQ